ncbi:MAG: hypothetical protein RIE53_06850 [Rhodothermales bacterium]
MRAERGFGKRELIESLRLAEDVVDELEETGLIHNPTFNRVYLRSLYSSYAAVLGVDARVLLEGIEAAMAGTYNGGLRVLMNAPSDASDDGVAPGSATGEEPEASPLVDAPEERPVSDDDPPAEHRTPHEASPEASLNASPESATIFTTAAPDTSLGQKRFLLPNTRGLATAVLSALVLMALIWFAVARLLSAPENSPDGAVGEDSVSIALSLPAVQEPDPVILPDTLTLFITARSEILDPVRVAVDEDIRRPYWVELDSTVSFRFVNRIQIDREAEHAAYSLDGWSVPDAWLTDGVFTVERTVAQAWFDSLTAAGVTPERNR